jgi:hypothetical protein
MKNLNQLTIQFLITFACLSFTTAIHAQTTYYSRNATSGGNWNTVNSWTTNSDGSGGPTVSVPQRGDHVVVLNGHTISINNKNDNGSSGIRPNDVPDPGLNIASFTGSGNTMFYHTGDITVESGGTLDVNALIMLGGTTAVSGDFITSSDLVNLGRMDVYSGRLDIGDDLVLSGYSETDINVSALSADDIYLDHTDAKLCGTGTLTLGDAIQEFNGADAALQVCSGFRLLGCGTCPFTGSGSFLLPVELYTYDVKLEDNNVRIDWSTASELDNDYFVVERSTDAYHFEEIGREEGAGFSESFRYYAITDRFPFEGISYYRLKQVDFDGTTTYFDIKMVDNKNGYVDEHGLTVFPNPIMEHNKFNIGLEGFDGDNVQVKIQNMSGFLIYSNEVDISQDRELIELETNIINDSGMYVLSVFNDNKWYHHKFMFVK